MKTRAAVAWEAGKPLEIETIEIAGPKEGEVLLRNVATGVCHTDAYTLSGADPEGIHDEDECPAHDTSLSSTTGVGGASSPVIMTAARSLRIAALAVSASWASTRAKGRSGPTSSPIPSTCVSPTA